LAAFNEWKRRNLGRHGQRGYHSFLDLPQDVSIYDLTFSTGWWELDQIFRFYPGQFTVCTGATGHGKTSFFLNIVCNLAANHRPSFLYVPENEPHLREQMERIWGEKNRDPLHQNVFVQSSASDLYEEPLTLDWVLAQAAIAVKRDKVQLVYIDPWNELEHAKPKDMLLTDYIGESLRWLRQFAREFKVAVVLVAHPTKAIQTERGKLRMPSLYDIEGSANWGNKPDNALILFSDTDGQIQVTAAKTRLKGSGKRWGKCWFTIDPLTDLFIPIEGTAT
jgi:twinkle protein